MTKEQAKEKAIKIADLLEEKKAKEIVVLDISKQTALTDYFIICSGESFTQINTLYEIVSEMMLSQNEKAINRKEILDENPWLLLDYGYLVIHFFHEEQKDYYNLEKLWVEGKVIYKSDVS